MRLRPHHALQIRHGVTHLSDLGARIQQAHLAALAAGQTAIVQAHACGTLLAEAKRDVPHGQWLSWLAEHCPDVSVQQAQRYMRIANRWDELQAATGETPTIPVRDALALLAEPREIVQLAQEIHTARREERRQERLEQIARQVDPGPLDRGRRYPVLLADPPWQYEHNPTDSRAIENHYDTMPLDAICALPVADVRTPDAVLFLWATSPKLYEAMRVLDAWGFCYRTCLVWVKDKIGMGYYARQRHELLLVATAGTFVRPAPSSLHDSVIETDSVIEAPRGAHSEKPALVNTMIEELYPTLPRLELFARQARPGWDSWGNEVAPAAAEAAS